jgi:hypothetical protein
MLWKVRLDSDRICKHVALLTDSHVDGGHEFFVTTLTPLTSRL